MDSLDILCWGLLILGDIDISHIEPLSEDAEECGLTDLHPSALQCTPYEGRRFHAIGDLLERFPDERGFHRVRLNPAFVLACPLVRIAIGGFPYALAFR